MKDTYKKSLEKEIRPIHDIIVHVQDSLQAIQQLNHSKRGARPVNQGQFFRYTRYALYTTALVHLSKVFMEKTSLYSNINTLIAKFDKNGLYRTIVIRQETVALWKQQLLKKQDSIAFILLARENILYPAEQSINYEISATDIERCLALNAVVKQIIEEMLSQVLKKQFL